MPTFYLQELITWPHLNAWALGTVVESMDLERALSLFHSSKNRQMADPEASLLGKQKVKKPEILGYCKVSKEGCAFWK